jgi:hypothetical protein
MATFQQLGPAGGPLGGPFDDDEGVNEVAGDRQIASVQVFSGETMDRMIVGYLQGSTPIPPIQHGGSGGGGPSEVFIIDVLGGEQITKVEGWVGVFDGTAEIFGLKITTNRKTSGVLGRVGPSHFEFPAPPGGHIFAFFGRQGLFVDALGVWGKIG